MLFRSLCLGSLEPAKQSDRIYLTRAEGLSSWKMLSTMTYETFFKIKNKRRAWVA